MSAEKIKASVIAGDKRPELELLLCCARTQMDDGQVARLELLLREELDWSYLLQEARSHGLVALLYRNLRTVARNKVPEEAFFELRRDFLVVGLHVHLLVQELLALLDLFGAHDIFALPFKGLVLAASAYGDPALRKPGDLDILVHREDFERARDLLVERGYRPFSQMAGQMTEGYLDRLMAIGFIKGRFHVDLHWTLEQRSFGMPSSWKFDSEHVLERCTEVPLADTTVRTLAPEDTLHFLCAHGAKHSWQLLYMICDIAEHIRGHPELDWRGVLQQAKRRESEHVLYPGLLLASELLGTKLPEEVSREIRSDPKVEALAREVSKWLFNPSSVAHHLKHYLFRIKTLERLPEKVSYLMARSRRRLSKSALNPKNWSLD